MSVWDEILVGLMLFSGEDCVFRLLRGIFEFVRHLVGLVGLSLSLGPNLKLGERVQRK